MADDIPALCPQRGPPRWPAVLAAAVPMLAAAPAQASCNGPFPLCRAFA